MSKEDAPDEPPRTPRWLAKLINGVLEACACGRVTGYDLYWTTPRENRTGQWHVELAPELVEVMGGPDDGASTYDPVSVDLLALQRCFTSLEACSYCGDHSPEGAALHVAGKVGRREVLVDVHLQPFEEAEASVATDDSGNYWEKAAPLDEDE